MAKKNNAPPPPESFEAAMAELDAIISRMEDGSLPLDEMLDAYKRGDELTRYCRGKLKNTQMEIKKLADNTLVDFPDDDK